LVAMSSFYKSCTDFTTLHYITFIEPFGVFPIHKQLHQQGV
jgi:hypothetical protein